MIVAAVRRWREPRPEWFEQGTGHAGHDCTAGPGRESCARLANEIAIEMNQQMLMQQLLAQSQQAASRPQVEFKCGKMKKAEGSTRVEPDLRKGKLTVKADQDQLMHLIWTNREQGTLCACAVRPTARDLQVTRARQQSPQTDAGLPAQALRKTT